MLFIVQVEVVYHPYMNPSKPPRTETYPVEAKDEKEVQEIVQAYFDGMSSQHESYYEVIGMAISPLLTRKSVGLQDDN